ncbi:MAG: hypothetical protein DRQ39_00850 [Gammaproteobacteria bacterium]|nr:MAG: hypothetical protein DRQ39_00850 [Gammaproteobacteria bacterium]RKZ96179.1 MAG: hypothetical protein DRQ40_01715 [Gammaproteobacteria bacterium]
MAGEEYEFRVPYWIRQNPILRAAWEEGIVEYGYDGAEDWVRATDEYARQFEGILRDDGSFRMTEGEYLSTMDSYRDSLRAVGVNPDLFAGQFVGLIKGDVSGNEFWQERVTPAYDRVIERGQEAINRYATDWDLEMTQEAILASLLDPDDIGSKILNRQIGISEIRYESDVSLGAAETNKYLDLTSELYEYGVDVGQARDLFQQADVMMPALSILASRHADPDDDFDLEEFTAATIHNDPEQARRIRRLMAQEASTFTGGRQTDYMSSQKTGGVSGLDVV